MGKKHTSSPYHVLYPVVHLHSLEVYLVLHQGNSDTAPYGVRPQDQVQEGGWYLVTPSEFEPFPNPLAYAGRLQPSTWHSSSTQLHEQLECLVGLP